MQDKEKQLHHAQEQLEHAQEQLHHAQEQVTLNSQSQTLAFRYTDIPLSQVYSFMLVVSSCFCQVMVTSQQHSVAAAY